MAPREINWHPAEYGMLLDCPFDEDFLRDLKAEVPQDEREWNPDRKMWWISDAYLDEIDAILFRHFEDEGYRERG